jgi:hypothetical protein
LFGTYVEYLAKRLGMRLEGNHTLAWRIQVMETLKKERYLEQDAYKQVPWNPNAASSIDRESLPKLPSVEDLEKLARDANKPLRGRQLNDAARDLGRPVWAERQARGINASDNARP